MTESAPSTYDLETPGNLKNARREWQADLWGRYGMVAVLVLALLGLFGPGPFSSREKSSDDEAITVEYYGIERHASPGELKIRVKQPTAGETLRLSVSREFTDHSKLESLVPQPVQTESEGGRIVYTFRLSPASEEAIVIYRYEHQSFGPLKYSVGVDDGSSVTISQWVMP